MRLPKQRAGLDGRKNVCTDAFFPMNAVEFFACSGNHRRNWTVLNLLLVEHANEGFTFANDV